MAEYLRLFDPTQQFQLKNGALNVSGRLLIYLSETDDLAEIYDENGVRLQQPAILDNNGRARGLFVDSAKTYWMDVQDQYGESLFTIRRMTPWGGGGGSIGVDIGSSDGSIDVQRTQIGSVVNYDLSVAADSTDLLGWGEYVGYTMDGTHMVPSYNAGTIETGPHGIRLQGGQYYHVTVTLGASSVEQNVYDAFQVSFKGVDGDGVVSTFTTKSFHYDASTGEGHSYDVSFDMMPATDVELYAEATGIESGISVGIAEVYVHRVYSGAPAIPGGVADKEWVEENYQEKLTAGTGITIENNVISAEGAFTQEQSDWAQTDSSAVDYIKHKPDLSVYATQTDLSTGLATKQDVISDLSTIRSGAALGATAVQDPDYVHTDNNFTDTDVTKLSGIEPGAEANVQADWTENDSSADDYIKNKPTTKHLVAGSNITITDSNNNITISASTPSVPVQDVQIDGTSVVNAQGIAEVPRQVNADWSSSAGASEILNKPHLATVATSGDYNDLSNKPTIPTVPTTDQQYNPNSTNPQSGTAVAEAIAGTGQVPTVTSADNDKVLTATYSGGVGSFAWQTPSTTQVQADWTEADSTDPSYIQNKPTLATVATSGDYNDLSNKPTIPAAQVNSDWSANSGVAQILNKPTVKPVLAGSNITITETANDFTIAASVPVIGTITV